jgi:hypothetical protein
MSSSENVNYSDVPASSSASSNETIEPDVIIPLNWEPKKTRGNKGATQYWIVENTKKCSEFCKGQLKVYILAIEAVTDDRFRLKASNGHLKPRKLKNIGLNIRRSSILRMGLLIFYASIATSSCVIPIATATKVHPT